MNRAIEEAYKTHIMQHKFPYTALFIDVPPFMVDVNVHPAKREFRFDNESALFKAVFHAVSDALSNKDLIPTVSTEEKVKKSVAPVTPVAKPVVTPVEQNKTTSVNPTTDTHTVTKSDVQSVTASAPVSEHKNTDYKVFDYNKSEEVREVRRPYNSTDCFSILESILPKEYRDKLKESDNISEAVTESKTNINQEINQEVKQDLNSERKIDVTPETQLDTKNEATIEANTESITEPISNPLKKGTYVQEELTETRYLSEAAREKHRIIGLAFDTYWITEYDNCLYLMDQHAAHEKVNYETFMEEFRNRKILSQNIYPPIVINLSSREKTAIMSNIEYLNKTGFEVEDFGGNDVKLSAVPANLLGLGSRDVFMELAAYLADEVTGVTEDIFVHKIATMGCKAAVKGNQKITVQEVETLIDRLMSLKDPYTCPHGRPTIIKVTKAEMDRKFKRIVN